MFLFIDYQYFNTPALLHEPRRYFRYKKIAAAGFYTCVLSRIKNSHQVAAAGTFQNGFILIVYKTRINFVSSEKSLSLADLTG
jgi:hypothetical protein